MKAQSLRVDFEDSRGQIQDLIQDQNINAITKITFVKGAVRGNHFHKKTIQWNYLISGKVLLVTQYGEKNKDEIILNPGDLVSTSINESHAIKALEDSVLLVFTEGPRGGKEYESDTYKLDEPLII